MIARFTQGARTFDISQHPYRLGADCIPPAANELHQITQGTSLNRAGGGSLVSTKAANRQWIFSVQILGTSAAEIEARVRSLSAFLTGYSELDTPLYFEFRDGDLPVPLWGQFGAPLRYEIVTASVSLGADYGSAALRSSGYTVIISLEVKPYAIGRDQRLASAMGGIYEDVIGMADGQSRGLGIPVTTTNRPNNPVFGAATWNDGWTEAANIVEARNTDQRLTYPGQISSAKLTARGSTNNIYIRSLNAGNTNPQSFSAIVARDDGEAVTSADCQIYYSTARTTTFESLGGGLYLAYADNITGINAATATGLVIANGRTVYLLAFQMEEKSRHTPIGHGDLLGWSWTSTAHGSTSSRVAGQVKLTVAQDTFNLGGGSFLVVWKPETASTAAGNRHLFDAGSMEAYYNATDDKFYFTDGTNTVSTGAQTFAAGDVLRLVFVYQPGELRIYVNGASAASGATYSPPAAPTAIYLGTDNSAANHAEGLFLQFQTYAEALAAADVTAIDDALTAGDRRDAIPWEWTKDGDSTVDQCDDSTRSNYIVMGGVPGNCPAVTDLKVSDATNEYRTTDDIYIGHHTDLYSQPRHPRIWWLEFGGISESGISNGDYITSFTGPPETPAVRYSNIPLIGSVDPHFHFFAAQRSSSGTINVYTAGFAGINGGYVYTEKVSSVGASFYSLIYAGSLTMEQNHSIPADEKMGQVSISTFCAGGRIDFGAVVNGNLTKISPRSTSIPSYGVITDTAQFFRLKGQSIVMENSAVGVAAEVTGEIIELVPGAYNLLQMFIMRSSTGYSYTRSSVFTHVIITPRWRLL